jgi:hypothetical protein
VAVFHCASCHGGLPSFEGVGSEVWELLYVRFRRRRIARTRSEDFEEPITTLKVTRKFLEMEFEDLEVGIKTGDEVGLKFKMSRFLCSSFLDKVSLRTCLLGNHITPIHQPLVLSLRR